MLASLRPRLLLLVAIALLPAFLVLFVQAQQQRQRAVERVGADALGMARLTSWYLDHMIQDTHSVLVSLADLPSLRSGDRAICEAALTALQPQLDGYINVGLVRPDGELFCLGPAAPAPTNLSDRLYVQRALATGEFAVGEIVLGRFSRKPQLNMAHPLRNAAGRIEYLLIASRDLGPLEQLARDVRLPRGATLTVIDERRMVLVRYPDPERWVGRPLNEIEPLAIPQQTEAVTESVGLDGVSRLTAVVPFQLEEVAGSQLFAILQLPSAVAFADVERQTRGGFLTLSLAALLALVLVWVASEAFLLRDVRALLGVTGRLTAGDLGARTAHAFGTRELGQVAAALNGMAQELQTDLAQREQAEAALREQEEQLRLVLEGSNDGFWDWNIVTGAVRFSPRWAEMLGYELAEIEPHLSAWEKLMHPDDLPHVMRVLTDHLEGRTPYYQTEQRLRTKSGEWKWILDRGKVVERDADGKPLRAAGTHTDLTERKQTEATLRRQEERFRVALESAKAGYWDWTIGTGEVRFSEGWVELLGYAPDEIAPTDDAWDGLIHADDLAAVIDAMDRHLAGAAALFEAEYRVRTKAGAWIWVFDRGRIVERDAAGVPLRAAGTLTDVTERKEAEAAAEALRARLGEQEKALAVLQERERSEQALEAQRAFLRQVMDTDPNLIFVKNWDGRFQLVNQAVADIYGATVDELVGKGDADFNPNAEEVAAYLEADRDVIRSRMPKLITAETVTDARTGQQRWFQTIKVPLLAADGETRHVLGVATDITAQRQALDALRESEEKLRQSQKMEAIGQLAGGVAHDFNNLLTVILSTSHLLQQQLPPGSDAHQDALDIARASERAATLTQQLLAFSRRQILAPRRLNLNAVIEETSQMLGRLIGEDVELATILAPDLGPVEVDPGQMQQVLLNMAVNARDAMPRGGRLTIETANADLDDHALRSFEDLAPGRYVLLAVSDNGHGMDADTLAHVFEPFFTTKEVGRGTGLGLSTVYGIVKQSGGDIRVYSEPGLGTSFKIYLPRAEASQAVNGERAGTVAAPRGTETILLVEDEEQVRRLARLMLEGVGYRVLEAESGAAALALCREYHERIHLLLTDVVMPGMNGRELQAELQRLRPGLITLFMSGYADGAIFQHQVLEPGVALLNKPFTPSVLARKVREALDGHATATNGHAAESPPSTRRPGA